MGRQIDITIEQMDHEKYQEGVDGHFNDGTMPAKGKNWNRIEDARRI
jgi:hypothetical protein